MYLSTLALIACALASATFGFCFCTILTCGKDAEKRANAPLTDEKGGIAEMKMCCPTCGCETHVYDTRESGLCGEFILRRRECKTCGTRFNTLETPVKASVRKSIRAKGGAKKDA